MNGVMFTPENIEAVCAFCDEYDRKEAARKKEEAAKELHKFQVKQAKRDKLRKNLHTAGSTLLRCLSICLVVVGGAMLFALTLGFVGVMGGADDGTWGRRR